MQKPVVKIIFSAFALALVGVGCTSAKKNTPPDFNTAQLKQPAPASPPQTEPVIPPEASKVPRPRL